jgi:hypothetical protein
MFSLSINKCYNEWFKSTNKFWMIFSSINQKGIHDYLNILKIAYFHSECENLIKKNLIMSLVFALTLLSKPLELV